MKRLLPNLDPPCHDERCWVCYRIECVCRACPVCGLTGDPGCYRDLNLSGDRGVPVRDHGRALTAEQYRSRLHFMEVWEKEALDFPEAEAELERYWQTTQEGEQ